MYFGVSNGQYKSRQLPGRGRGPPPLSSTAPSKMPPELSTYEFCSSKRYREGCRGPSPKVLKSGFPKIRSTQSLSTENSSGTFKSFRAIYFCVLRNNGRGGGGGESTGSRWESDKEKHKKGGGYCVQVSGSHCSAESDPFRDRDSGSVPAGLGTQAAAASGLRPVGESS